MAHRVSSTAVVASRTSHLAAEYADQVVLLQKGKSCGRVSASVYQRDLLGRGVFHTPLTVEQGSNVRPRVNFVATS